jgi:hypothetical protein
VANVKDPAPVPGTNQVVIEARAKFVNGTQDIVTTVEFVPPWSFRIDDLTIGEYSLRSK